MKIVVCGAEGHMGRLVVECLGEALPGAELVKVSPRLSCARLKDAPAADCAIDFSFHTVTPELAEYGVRTGTPLVVGTTGQTPEEMAALLQAAERIPVFLSRNLSLGAALLGRFAEMAARAMPDADVEIVETHHNRKADAPSGTALVLAECVRSARPGSVVVTERSGRRKPEEIGVHSLRMGNVPGVHEVYLAAPAETLVLRHEVHDRRIFADGAVRAAKFLMGKPAGYYGMEDLLREEWRD